MLTEDFCSFEVAKLLKEKGFNKFSYYGWDEQLFDKEHPRNFSIGIDDKKRWISCHTHQMAMKLLREVHKLHISIKPTWALGDMREPCRWEYDIINLATSVDPMYYVGKSTYEEAVEAAILYSLENLI